MDISYNEICNNIQGINELDSVEQFQEVDHLDDLRGTPIKHNVNVDDLIGTTIKHNVNVDEILLGTKLDDHFLKNVEDWNETFNYGLSEFERYSLDEFKENINNYSNIDIKVDEDTESNYKYYSFEATTNNGFISHTSLKVFIVVFESYNSTLININDTIMPLYDFINITYMNEVNDITHDIVNELRKVPFTGDTIRCYTEWTQKEFIIKNVSISILMRAISYFQQIEKDKEKELDKDNLVNDVIVNEFINHKTEKKDNKEHIGLLRSLYNILKWALW